MKKNYYDEILKLLDHDNWITAKRLASFLHISEKTVRNHINTINNQEDIILSSTKGYKLKRKVKQTNKKKPITQQERIFFIVKELINQENNLSSYDICEKLFISEATLSKDIAVLRNSLSKFELTLKKSKGIFYLYGSEENKRKLVRDIIIGSGNDFSQYCEFNFFNDSYININEIKEIILNTLQEYHFFINDYSLSNILLHAYIVINRLLKKKQLDSCHFDDVDSFPSEKKVACAICDKISAKYNIHFSENEINQFTFLLITKTSSIDFYKLNQENIENIIGNDIYDMSKHLIEKVLHHFLLDIYDEEFILKFSLHLKNTLFRVKNGYQERNPIMTDIKTSYPLIYDIAVFIALEIKKMTNYILNEGEITFLAIHIGSIINSQNKLTHKIKCVLVYHKYYDYHQSILMKLNRFSEDLEIIAICSSEDKLPDIHFDIILSTIPFKQSKYPVILIHPFLNDQDYYHISQKIFEYKQALNIKIVSNYFSSFFEEDLFETEHYFKDRFEMIRYMANQIIKKGYADQSFTDAVIERELIASTSFDNFIAIPHTVETSTTKNTGCIINKTAMQWDNYPVNLVIMIGVNKEKQNEFNDLYTHLLNILDDPEQTQQLIHCTNYQQFIFLLTHSEKKE